MAVITDNPDDEMFDERGRITKWWSGWLHSVFLCCFSTQDSGPTASRPTVELWVGRRYFDTTLGKPIWLKSVGPIVWVDATGAPV